MKEGNEPILSVIVPVYNIESFLPQCLESLIGQTFSQLEIICVDDASEDQTANIVKMYQKKDPRVWLLQQTHQGVSAARNLGIQHSRGKYIVFVDGDDWVDADLFEKMVSTAENSACDIVVCSSEVHFQQETHHKSLQTALTVKNLLWTHGDPWCAVQYPGSWPFVWNKLIRSELIKENKINFSTCLSLGEDGLFVHLLFQYAKSVVFLSQPLYHYRYQRKASATDKLCQNQEVRFAQHVDVVSEMLREFSERGLLGTNGCNLLRWNLDFLYLDYISLPAESRQDVSHKLQALFVQYSLHSFSKDLLSVEKKRLKNMLTAKKCTEGKRLLDIVVTKIENRIMRVFIRNDQKPGSINKPKVK